MCPSATQRFPQGTWHRQQGAAIMAAIFLLVALSALGGYMLNFTNVQQSTSALDVEGTRAYWAAKSGLDWGIHQAYRNAAYGCACTNGCSATVAPVTQTASVVFGSFTATVACTCVPVCEAGASKRIYKYAVNACNQPSGGTCPNASPTSANYVNRQLFGSIVN